MNLIEYRKYLDSKHIKSVKFVKVREIRQCKNCKKSIEKGRECLTVSKKYKGRFWLCLDCVQDRLELREKHNNKVQNLANARAFKNTIAFGDEGGYMAACDWEAEAEAELDEFEDDNYDIMYDGGL